MTKTKKNGLIALSVCTFLASMTVGALLKTDFIAAEANSNDFMMIKGASIRVSETTNESGIRFIAKVPETTEENREYRMLIVPSNILLNKDIEGNYVDALKSAYPEYANNFTEYFYDVKVTPFEDVNPKTNYGRVVCAAMAVDEKHYNVEFTGIAYYLDGEEEVYATFDEGRNALSNARSIAYVASAALNDTNYAFEDLQVDTLATYVNSALNTDSLLSGIYDEVSTAGGEQEVKADAKSRLSLKLVSSDETVVTVDNDKCSYTPKKDGYATITATIGAQYEYLEQKYVAEREIFVGFDRDMRLQDHVVSSGDVAHQNYACNLAYSNVKYADEGVTITKPNDLESVSCSKYDVTLKATTYGRQFGLPIQFSGIDDRYIDTENIDWNNAYIGFFVYTKFNSTHTSTPTLAFFLRDNASKNNGTYMTTVPNDAVYVTSGEWSYVKLSLADYAQTIQAGEYMLDVCFVYAKATTTDFSETVYIDGVQVFNEKQIGDTEDYLLLSHCIANSSTVNANYAKTVVTTSVVEYTTEFTKTDEMPDNSTGCVKYEIEATAPLGNYYSCPISIGNTGKGSIAVTADMLATFSVTDWTKAYVGFWVYNDSNIALDFITTNSGNRDYWSGKSFKAVANQWTYIEISLADAYGFTSNIFAESEYNFKLFSRYSGTGYNTDETYQNFSGCYYIDGFSIYNKEVRQ